MAGVGGLLLPDSGQHEKQQREMTRLSDSAVTSAKRNQDECTIILEREEREREVETEGEREAWLNQEMSNKMPVTEAAPVWMCSALPEHPELNILNNL